jgi:hypothetical protein
LTQEEATDSYSSSFDNPTKFLDILVSNFDPGKASCPQGLISLEIQMNLLKSDAQNADQNSFYSVISNYFAVGNLGSPEAGPLESAPSVDGRATLQGLSAASFCAGPSFYIDQNPQFFTATFSTIGDNGNYPDTTSTEMGIDTANTLIGNIVSTFKFSK